jgi:predicted ArsR family transcriptional regulator
MTNTNTTTTRRNRNATMDLLVKIRVTAKDSADGSVTAKDVESNAIYMGRLVERGFIRQSARNPKVMTGERGRPAHRYVVTLQGHNQLRRIDAQRKRQAA